MRLPFVGICLSLGGLFPLFAGAVECPVHLGNTNYIELVQDEIRSAASCDAGADIAKACALKLALDPSMVSVAQKKCEKDFLKHLKGSELSSYRRLQNRCEKKFRNTPGMLAISQRSFCHLRLARLYSDLFLTR